jgi:FkbM family methyltransferase
MSHSFATQLELLKCEFQKRTDFDTLADLIKEVGVLTKASIWGPNEFDKGVILYGAGSIGAGAFDFFTQNRINVLGFIDDTPGRAGKKFCGADILSLSSAMQIDCPIVISMKLWQVPAARLSDFGRPCEAFSHHVFRTNLNRLKQVSAGVLSDDRSRLVYVTILKANILADYSFYRDVCEGDQYWAPKDFQFRPDVNAVMIDAGAYVGDTLEEFVWRTRGVFKQIHSFEPDLKRFHALQTRAKRLREEWAIEDNAIACVRAGLGDQEAKLPFFEHLTGLDGSFLFSHGQQGGELQIRKLDEYLAGAPVSFIKADIEGYEIPLIIGASESIRKYRPRIAICIYHRLTDVIEIPLLLRKLVPEYHMAVRHHSLSQDESVLYCWA